MPKPSEQAAAAELAEPVSARDGAQVAEPAGGRLAAPERGESGVVPGARVSHAAWLSNLVLLAVGTVPAKGQSPTATLIVNGEPAKDVQVEALRFKPPGARHEIGVVIVALFGSVTPQEAVEIGFGDGPTLRTETEPETAVRQALAMLSAAERDRVLEFIVTVAAPHVGGREQIELAESLRLLRDALRETLPRCVMTEARLPRLNVESVYRIDGISFFATGWMREEDGAIERLTVVAPEGVAVELFDRVFRTKRPDVSATYKAPRADDKPGFVVHFTLPRGGQLDDGWLFEVENADGGSWEAVGPSVRRDLADARSAILGELDRVNDRSAPALLDHLIPAVSSLQAQLAEQVEVEVDEEIGTVPAAPVTSIVVPLYGRIDLVQHQLASFADDSEMRAVELVYVLDSPELADALLAQTGDLHEIYRVPFRVVVLNRNGGYSVVNNIGAQRVRGRLLLLLNSDVLAGETGWVSQLTDCYDATGGIGALGPKLIFDDGSLQHAGLYFRRLSGSTPWENAHYYKGMHADLTVANVKRRVPALTGACMMIDRELYLEQGGLSSAYIQGDCEDSDLCLRLTAAGRENWYLPQVELYHLEGRSYLTEARQVNARYNAWLQTRRWGSLIESLMSEPRFDPAAPHSEPTPPDAQ